MNTESGEAHAELKQQVLAAVIERFGDRQLSWGWYANTTLAEFGDRTPAQLVESGQAHALLDYLAATDTHGAG